MNILIAGGAGFIGSHLVRYYLRNNNQVVVLDNFITGSPDNLKSVTEDKNLKLIKADLTNYDLSTLPRFDLIYDLASPASPADFEKLSYEILTVNSIGLIRLLDFLVKSKSNTLVYASSSEVYGDPEISPQPETYYGNVHTTGLRSCYDEGKRFAEAVAYSYIRKHNVDIRLARIFNTYGPFMKKNDGRFISNFINQAIENKPITVYGSGSQTRSSCFVSDMINALVKLGETKDLKGQIINLGNPDERKVIEVANLIKKLTGSQSEIVHRPMPEDDPKRRQPDITKAKQMLKWSPSIKLEEGLKLTIDYFKSV